MIKTPIKIGLVDDHILVREAIANIIRSFDEFSVCLMADNGKDLINKLTDNNAPDIILLDVSMPEMDGHETTQWLSKYHPKIKILLLTVYDAESLIHLIRAGVKGFLKKDIQPAELKSALHCIVENGTYCSHTVTGRLFNLMRSHTTKDSTWGSVALTENEIVFLKLVVSEMTYKEIAVKMQVSPRTVDNYRDHLFVKLAVKSRVGLVMYAIKTGIVDINNR